MGFLKIVFILMPVSLYLALIYTPPANMLGESSRIIYFHVPAAWVSVLAFIVSGIFSIITLLQKKYTQDFSHTAYNSAYLGIFFSIMTLASGSIWSRISWGSYWNWDPRQTSMLILLMIYIAYFALHSSIKNRLAAQRITSSYLIIAALIMPLFVFIIPRIYPSLHPDPVVNTEGKIHLEGSMTMALILSTISFTILYVYILNLMNRVNKIEMRLEERA